jgi:phosphohistidine phosphatase SixA
VAIYLIRHGQAGGRSEWDGDDERRPLTGRGKRQARHLVTLLGDRPLGRVYSSPFDRCVQTVEPLAAHFHQKVKAVAQLEEGADADAAIAFALAHAEDNPALCTHGDLVPKMIHRLYRTGMRTTDANLSQKGSLWILDVKGGEVVRGTYYPPG